MGGDHVGRVVAGDVADDPGTLESERPAEALAGAAEQGDAVGSAERRAREYRDRGESATLGVCLCCRSPETAPHQRIGTTADREQRRCDAALVQPALDRLDDRDGRALFPRADAELLASSVVAHRGAIEEAVETQHEGVDKLWVGAREIDLDHFTPQPR